MTFNQIILEELNKDYKIFIKIDPYILSNLSNGRTEEIYRKEVEKFKQRIVFDAVGIINSMTFNKQTKVFSNGLLDVHVDNKSLSSKNSNVIFYTRGIVLPIQLVTNKLYHGLNTHRDKIHSVRITSSDEIFKQTLSPETNKQFGNELSDF